MRSCLPRKFCCVCLRFSPDSNRSGRLDPLFLLDALHETYLTPIEKASGADAAANAADTAQFEQLKAWFDATMPGLSAAPADDDILGPSATVPFIPPVPAAATTVRPPLMMRLSTPDPTVPINAATTTPVAPSQTTVAPPPIPTFAPAAVGASTATVVRLPPGLFTDTPAPAPATASGAGGAIPPDGIVYKVDGRVVVLPPRTPHPSFASWEIDHNRFELKQILGKGECVCVWGCREKFMYGSDDGDVGYFVDCTGSTCLACGKLSCFYHKLLGTIGTVVRPIRCRCRVIRRSC